MGKMRFFLLCITVSGRNVKLSVDIKMRKKLNKSFDIVLQILRLNHADIARFETDFRRNVEFDGTRILKMICRGHPFTSYQSCPKWIIRTVAAFAIFDLVLIYDIYRSIKTTFKQVIKNSKVKGYNKANDASRNVEKSNLRMFLLACI